MPASISPEIFLAILGTRRSVILFLETPFYIQYMHDYIKEVEKEYTSSCTTTLAPPIEQLRQQLT
jgi:hypothetical protein